MVAETPSPALQRKRRLEAELERYLPLLIENQQPERVILFGSLVAGTIHEWSDIDLVIVKQTDRPFMQRLHEISDLLQPQVGADIFVYTPEEFKQLCQERPFFQDEILNKGMLLYERPS